MVTSHPWDCQNSCLQAGVWLTPTLMPLVLKAQQFHICNALLSHIWNKHTCKTTSDICIWPYLHCIFTTTNWLTSKPAKMTKTSQTFSSSSRHNPQATTKNKYWFLWSPHIIHFENLISIFKTVGMWMRSLVRQKRISWVFLQKYILLFTPKMLETLSNCQQKKKYCISQVHHQILPWVWHMQTIVSNRQD